MSAAYRGSVERFCRGFQPYEKLVEQRARGARDEIAGGAKCGRDARISTRSIGLVRISLL